MRYIPWFTDPNKKLVSIQFDPNSNWILGVSKNCTIYIISISKLMKCIDKQNNKNKRMQQQKFRPSAAKHIQNSTIYDEWNQFDLKTISSVINDTSYIYLKRRGSTDIMKIYGSHILFSSGL